MLQDLVVMEVLLVLEEEMAVRTTTVEAVELRLSCLFLILQVTVEMEA
jgi:hypothetical protein